MVRSFRQPRADRTADAAVAPAAALLADPARVAMLLALLDGRALPAGDLARIARIKPSTASAHLRRLLNAGWVGAEPHGRHRDIRLINDQVAGVLEALAVIGTGSASSPTGAPPIGNDLRLGRSCHDHLAGMAGVLLTEAMVTEGTLALDGRTYGITPAGAGRLSRLGIDTEAVRLAARRSGRFLTRACLDWSERRYHLAGALGARLLQRVFELGWFERRRGTRALTLTNLGRRAVQRAFGVRLM